MYDDGILEGVEIILAVGDSGRRLVFENLKNYLDKKGFRTKGLDCFLGDLERFHLVEQSGSYIGLGVIGRQYYATLKK